MSGPEGSSNKQSTLCATAKPEFILCLQKICISTFFISFLLLNSLTLHRYKDILLRRGFCHAYSLTDTQFKLTELLDIAR